MVVEKEVLVAGDTVIRTVVVEKEVLVAGETVIQTVVVERVVEVERVVTVLVGDVQPSGPYDPNASYSVTIKTNKGDIKADLYNDIASIYVENFVNLANDGFYTNSQWHLVIPGFVIQGGTNVAGKQADQFDDVFHPDMKHDSAGILSMANSGFNTNTSQFFVTHDAAPYLDPYVNGQLKPCEVRGTPCHAVFGKVTSGMEVVRAIEQGDIMESVVIHQE